MKIRLSANRSEELRRTALQLAIQLPAEIEEARAVVDELAEILEHYMVRGPRSAWERPQLSAGAADRALVPAAAAWSTAATIVCALLGSALFHAFGYGGLLLNFCATAAIGVVFGRRYAVLMIVPMAALYNLLAMPPLLSFSAPSHLELIYVFADLFAAIVVPALAAHAKLLRAAAIASCALPHAKAAAHPLRD